MNKSAESTAQRVRDAVRRIAKQTIDEGGGLVPAQPKAAIGRTRGVAFYNSNGDIESNEGELPDEAETETPEQNDGSQTKDRNPSPISDDYDVGDKADEFEAYDCTTGQRLHIDLAPIPGEEFPTPEGWSSPNTPPPDQTYVAGWHYWYNYTVIVYRGATMSQFLSALLSHPDILSVRHISGKRFEYTNRWGTFQKSALSVSCGGSTAGYCNPQPEDLLLESQWPVNGAAQLVVQNGQFVASEYDPEAGAYANNPQSSIEVCDGLGARYELNSLENGGAMITKLEQGAVDPNGTSLVVDENGVVTNRVSNRVRDSYL